MENHKDPPLRDVQHPYGVAQNHRAEIQRMTVVFLRSCLLRSSVGFYGGSSSLCNGVCIAEHKSKCVLNIAKPLHVWLAFAVSLGRVRSVDAAHNLLYMQS